MSDAGGGRSAFVVGAGILISRVVGLLRNTVFAYYFGAGAASDAYNAAFKIPNACLLYTSPSPRDRQKSRMPSSA